MVSKLRFHHQFLLFNRAIFRSVCECYCLLVGKQNAKWLSCFPDLLMGAVREKSSTSFRLSFSPCWIFAAIKTKLTSSLLAQSCRLCQNSFSRCFVGRGWDSNKGTRFSFQHAIQIHFKRLLQCSLKLLLNKEGFSKEEGEYARRKLFSVRQKVGASILK